ncbi:DUF6458 family protein [Rathayibacter soli]|uniref:DUF6458 family protein n=1 Tax=Rathayibacter soli TaxID=3144168 RepID=UPI0027E50484|nr:DUF6458 family protein [Glaciibacter superstes]
MSIGTGIVLFVIGAILTFALNIQVAWIDLHLVGYIFMGAGVVVFIIGIILVSRHRRATTTSRSAVDPVDGARVTRSTSEIDDPPV